MGDAQQVWLVRHGETEWSRTGRHTGRTDVPLTETGREAARALRRHLPARRFAAVWSSPLQRAVQTAALAGFEHPQLQADLREWDYGDYDGLTTPQIRAERPGWNLWRDGTPGGESAAEVGARADRVVALARRVDGDVLVFAHGHLLRVLAARWVGLAAADGAVLALEPATLSVLGYERETPVIASWNAAPG